MTGTTKSKPLRLKLPPPILTEAEKDVFHDRLMSRCEIDNLTNCWVFVGAWDKSGVGVIKVSGRVITVPRLSAWIYLGGFDVWDKTVKVRHCRECPACFNPAHLRIERSTVAVLPMAQPSLAEVA